MKSRVHKICFLIVNLSNKDQYQSQSLFHFEAHSGGGYGHELSSQGPEFEFWVHYLLGV